ncbi:MAG: Appr-1-p processing protein [Actinobacteria bacterium]|nr:MAG: Appr-1-p processing protein [Actinomycetota bacterium]
MVTVIKGDIFKSNAQTLVNTVNCVGVMGKGIALEFKKRFPEMYDDYLKKCSQNQVKMGEPYLYKSSTKKWVLNFPTKDHWRSISNLEDIVQGLNYLIQHYKEWGITSLAVPPLGTGQGQLEWKVVGKTLYRYLGRLDIPVELYAPYDVSNEQLQLDFLTSEQNNNGDPEWITPSIFALVEIVKRIESHPYHPAIGRTMFQKIAYVATEEGIPTNIKYEKASYGPFSLDIKLIMARLNNNGLIREKHLGRMFLIKIGPTYNDAFNEFHNQIKQWDEIINKTTDLFMRIQSTDCAELITTVIFAAKDLMAKKDTHQVTELEVLDYVMDWKKRRRPALNKSDVSNTIRNLSALNWLNVKPSEDLPVDEEIIA